MFAFWKHAIATEAARVTGFDDSEADARRSMAAIAVPVACARASEFDSEDCAGRRPTSWSPGVPNASAGPKLIAYGREFAAQMLAPACAERPTAIFAVNDFLSSA